MAKTKKLCKLCHERIAEVRDRERPWNPVATICRECHAERLAGDMRAILAAHGGEE